MNDPIKDLLNHAGDVTPPTAFDVDAQIRRGKKASARRGIAVGGLTTGVVAIIGAALVALPMLTAPGGNAAGPNPSSSSSAPAVRIDMPGDLPDLMSNDWYKWSTGEMADLPDSSSQNDLTRQYQEAFYAFVNSEYGGTTGGQISNGVWRNEYSLQQWTQNPLQFDELGQTINVDPPTVIATQPRYTLNFGFRPFKDKEGLYLDEAEADRHDDTAEHVRITMMPPGGFTDGVEGNFEIYSSQGRESWFDLAHCAPFNRHIQAGQISAVDATCDEAAGPAGGRVVNVTETSRGSAGEYVTRKVVLYREDGSAVVVEHMPNEAGHLSLDFAGLLKLAAALPSDPIE